MTDTSRHHLPLLAAGQAQKEVTHNEAVLAIDRMLQLAVASRALAVAPAMPADGAIYIVAAAPSGAWLGHAGRLASHDGYGWSFTDPVQGCLAWIADETVFTVYDGAWSQGGWPASGLRAAGRRPPDALGTAGRHRRIDGRQCYRCRSPGRDRRADRSAAEPGPGSVS